MESDQAHQDALKDLLAVRIALRRSRGELAVIRLQIEQTIWHCERGHELVSAALRKLESRKDGAPWVKNSASPTPRRMAS